MRFNVQKASVSIEETSSPTPPPTPAISAVMENSKPHFATVTFAQTPPEQIDTPLIEKEPEPFVEEAQLTKTKKPFKVQYFKDEKSLQCKRNSQHLIPTKSLLNKLNF